VLEFSLAVKWVAPSLLLVPSSKATKAHCQSGILAEAKGVSAQLNCNIFLLAFPFMRVSTL
jgi:hypothetical protein